MKLPTEQLKNRVLNCSRDEELRRLRATILEMHGCTVVSPNEPDDAILEMNSSRFDVLLLCYQLGTNAVKRLVDEFRRQFPGGKIVAIENGTLFGGCVPDVTVSAHAPAEMVRAVC